MDMQGVIDGRKKYIQQFQAHCDKYLTKICDPKGKKILIIGCGYGTEILWCIRKKASYIVGVDIAKRDIDALNLAVNELDIPKENIPFYTILQATSCNIERNCFDIILSNNTFEHILELEKTFNSFRNLLNKNSGYIAIFSDPLFYSSCGHHTPLKEWEHLLLDDTQLSSRLTPYFFRQYTKCLNKMNLITFLAAARSSGLVLYDLFVINDRNRLLFDKNKQGLLDDIPPFDLFMEGFGCKLCYPEAMATLKKLP